MASLCPVAVTFTAAPRDYSVRIEALDHPDDLLYIAEGETAASVYHHAWSYLREHREQPVAALDQRFGPAMSYARRYRVMGWMYWLLRLITNQQEGR